jgi:hypothetical protein
MMVPAPSPILLEQQQPTSQLPDGELDAFIATKEVYLIQSEIRDLLCK